MAHFSLLIQLGHLVLEFLLFIVDFDDFAFGHSFLDDV
jgi:hypothetical protein